jgi:hypothetical protein
VVFDDDGRDHVIDENAVVSMNFWGFTPKYFDQSEQDFRIFIHENADQLKAEFYIPSVVNKLIETGEATCRMLTSNDHWFGVTYQQDKPITIARINDLVEIGTYPSDLWK